MTTGTLPTNRTPHRLAVAVRTAVVAAGVAASTALGAGIAQAAGTPASLPKPPTSGPLRIEANIALGVSLPVDTLPQGGASTEAPNGAVFFGNGSIVDVVETTGAPQVAVHATGKVMALAASTTDLYVLAGKTVTDYSRSNGAVVQSWTLPSSLGTPTSAGLFARPGVVWLWTDNETDTSGFEYASITALTAHSQAHVIDNSAEPRQIDSDANGFLYYADSAGRLVRASANGKRFVSPDPISSPITLAISNGRLVTSTYATTSYSIYTDWYMTSLTRISVRKVSNEFGLAYANTGAGLIGWDIQDGPNLSEQVGRVGLSSGTVSDALTVDGVSEVLEGYYPAIISNVNGHLHLVRLD